MFAAVARSPGDIVIDDIPEPGHPRAGWVVVRPETVGICGSDLHLFSGHTGALSRPRDFFPGIQGHEISANAAFPAGDLDAGCTEFAGPMSIAVNALRRAGPIGLATVLAATANQITVSGGGAET